MAFACLIAINGLFEMMSYSSIRQPLGQTTALAFGIVFDIGFFCILSFVASFFKRATVLALALDLTLSFSLLVSRYFEIMLCLPSPASGACDGIHLLVIVFGIQSV